MAGMATAQGSGPSGNWAVWDADDFGANHVISDQTQSHDCRDVLTALKAANPKFKATLFSIPAYMTQELLDWTRDNQDWIEIAVHGFYHRSNYECEKMTLKELTYEMTGFDKMIGQYFRFGFKAPGWQISDDILKWLDENFWWVADQAYNDERRPKTLKNYVIRDGGWPKNPDSQSMHFHTWNCVGNGVYELFDQMLEKVKQTDEFFFVSEAIHG